MTRKFILVSLLNSALASVGVLAQTPQPAPIEGPAPPAYVPGVTYQTDQSQLSDPQSVLL